MVQNEREQKRKKKGDHIEMKKRKKGKRNDVI